MAENEKKTVGSILSALGGTENIGKVTNCMTRLRVFVKQESRVDESGLKKIPGVLGVVHDVENYYEVVVGPGKSARYAGICHDCGIASAGPAEEKTQSENRNPGRGGRLKAFLKTFGNIFVPLIPGIIAAGICAGTAMLISQAVPGYQDSPLWNGIYQVLELIRISFMTYITAWTGFRAAETFGATPILGGMLGLITGLDGINTISKILGLYNTEVPLDSVLCSGKGGVLAVVFGVFLLAAIEKRVRKMMPESMDTVLTPVLTLIFCLIPYIFLVMPAFGYISTGIAWAVGKVCMSESVIVRAAAGFISTAIFLPLVAMGMHHGLIALYTVQLQTLGFVTLYPALAMAGAGQVGAAIAILQKAKETGNSGMIRIIRGALPAGFLGVGEPLIYGVTLPMGKPFLTAGLGAGFGGAFVMIMQVASTTWGPSGLLGIFVMTAGPNGAVRSILYYLIGLGISYVMGYLITKAAVPAEDTKPETAGHTKQAEKTEPAREAVQPEDGKIDNGKPEDRKPDEMRTAAAAPVSGAFVAMQDITDPTFSEGLLGPCCGIEPDSGRICAPMDGTVTLIAETGHSFSIEGRDGLSVLVHIGIDTVKLNGEGFRVLAHLNDEVKQGEPVIEADPDFIRKNGLSAMVITAVVDNDDPDSFCFTKERMLRAGDSMILNK